jgi:uncharacterized protein YprB with RNaseH-like and TPR domain
LKTLFLDIELSPIIAHVWKMFDVTVGLNQLQVDWAILAFAAKWEGSDEIIYMDVREEKNLYDDGQLVQKLHALLDEADTVVAHNGRRFDIKKINSRIILNGLTPPSPYQIIDTLDVAKRHFGFTSNKLEYLTQKLCTKFTKMTGRKFAGHSLWNACHNRIPEAWIELEEYNKLDVLSLEELFNVFRPWISTLSVSSAVDSGPTCPKCGSTHITYRGVRKTLTGEYRRVQCQSCGGWSQSRFAEKGTTKQQGLKGS